MYNYKYGRYVLIISKSSNTPYLIINYYERFK